MQIGIDLGATKIESIVLDDKGEELYREREESPHNYQETLNLINLIVNKIEKKFNKKL
jgi:fructokinase